MGSSKYEFDANLDKDVKKRHEVIDQLYSEINVFISNKYQEQNLTCNIEYTEFIKEVAKYFICKINGYSLDLITNINHETAFSIYEYSFDKSLEYQKRMEGNGSYETFLNELVQQFIVDLQK